MSRLLLSSQRKRQPVFVVLILVTLLFCSAGRSYCLVVWANNGEDKVTRDELRATANPAGMNNSIWGGSRISLFGGRNETVSFCLILESSEQSTENISVVFDTLADPGGALIHSIPAAGAGVFNWINRSIELFYVRYLQIRGLGKLLFQDYDERHVPTRFRRPWTDDGFAVAGSGWKDRPDHDTYYPDIAIPLELESPFDIPAGRNQAVWVDVYIPKTSPPGRYTGTVQIKASGQVVKTVPVTLDVRNFTLPDDPSLKTMVALGYEDINQRYVHPDRPYPWEPANRAKSSRIIDKHFQLAHRHRISLISAEPDPHERDYPDPHWLPRFSGELFSAGNGYDGPGVGIGNMVFSIGTYSSWYWKGQGEAAMRTHTDAWADWLDANAPGADYFLYLIDESDNFPQIEQWASWIKNNPGTGKRVQSFATLNYENGVSKTPSLDIPCAGGYNAPTAVVEEAVHQIRTSSDKRLWWYNGERPYTGTFSTMDDGVALRVLAWSQFKKHIERWFYWSATYYNNYQGGTGQTNVFESAFTYGAKNTDLDPISGETGWNYSNGDGVLFYPGTDLQYPQESYNLEGPFASLRLKHWRRGLQDGDYLTLAAAVDPAAVEEIVTRMLPRTLWEYGVSEPSDPTYVHTDISWSIDPDDWEAARRQLADIIEAGNSEGWDVYDNDPPGATIANVDDPDRGSRVIEFTGSGTANGYRLRNPDGSWWNNGAHKVIQWSMKYSENYTVYVAVQTTDGFRYIRYNALDHDNLGTGTYIHHGLGTGSRDGNWHTFTRNLEHDLHDAQPENNLVAILGFLIRGSGRVDDIKTLASYPADLDSDGDGLTDLDEINIYATSPSRRDTDNDGIADQEEIAYWGSSWSEDADNDGIINLLDADSDNDGIGDGTEVNLGTNPADAASVSSSIVYEDAEDGNTEGWDVYDNDPAAATIANVDDPDRGSRVIEFSGSGEANGYRLRNPGGTWWNNGAHKVIQWSMKYSENYTIFIAVQTTDGFRYIKYNRLDHDNLGTGTYVHHGLGAGSRDGNWHTITRDLEQDLHDAQPDNDIVSILGFLIRGSGRVDDIKTLNQ